MFSRRNLLTVTAVLALLAVPSAAGEPFDGYTASGSPTHVKPATQSTFTITLTNKLTSPKEADKAKIGIPPNFVVDGGSVQASANAAGTCLASAWVADGTLISDGKINLKPAGSGPTSRLCPGATLTVKFSATSSPAEGTYIWATELFRTSDALILSGPQPSVQVDGTPPTVTIDSHPADPTKVAVPSFAFSASETADFACRLDGGSFSACASPKSYPALPDGAHTFTVRATDAAGNAGQASYGWTVDTLAPTATITQKPANPSNDSSPTFAFAANEAATFQCNLDDAAFESCSPPKSYTAGDGPHTFRVRATDAAGNTGQVSYGWTIDTVAPRTTITSGPNDPSGVNSASFGFSASEAASFQCKLDGASFVACSSPKSYSNLPDGVRTFSVRATDPAGNTGEPVSYDWLIETDLPVVTLTATPPRSSNSSAATFFFTANKPATSFECKLDGGAFVACTSPKAYSGVADGPHTFAVKGTATGGTGPATVYTWAIDTTGPTAAISQKPSDPTNSRVASFAFASSEPGGFQCKVDSSAFASCTSPQLFSNLTDGRHTFVVRAVDALSNVGPETTYSWTIETRVPIIAVTSAPPALSNSPTATLSFSTDEPATFQCSLDNSGFEVCTSPASYAGLRDGGHSFVVRGTDAAGNVAAASHAWTTDATAPQTRVDSAPAKRTTAKSAKFAFSSSEPGMFQCRIDGRSFAPCSAPKTYKGLTAGVHRFAVRAVDQAGNLDPTPAVSSWIVGRPVTRTAAGSALLTPSIGARVTRPPVLRWRVVRGATYYNVQLYRAGRKVLTTWPGQPKLKLQRQWRLNGVVQHLEAGPYRWYVWPGFGRKAERRYGQLLGTSTFTVGRAPPQR
jgi:large repetitive protein